MASKVNVGLLFKDDSDYRNSEFGNATNLFDLRQAAHHPFNRVGDETFNFHRRQRTGFGDDGDLDIRHVRNGIDRQVEGTVDTGNGHQNRRDDDDEAISQTKFDDFLQHDFSPPLG